MTASSKKKDPGVAKLLQFYTGRKASLRSCYLYDREEQGDRLYEHTKIGSPFNHEMVVAHALVGALPEYGLVSDSRYSNFIPMSTVSFPLVDSPAILPLDSIPPTLSSHRVVEFPVLEC